MEPELPTSPDSSRTRLLHAAIKIFSEKQFDGASIRDISGLAGTNSSQIFFYFRDKEGLYLEALRFACRLGTRLVNTLPEPPDPQDPDAIAKAKYALRANIRMFVRLGVFSRLDPNAGKLPELEHFALMLLSQEIRYPRKAAEGIILEGLKPHTNHMVQCIRAIRPDLSEEANFHICISIHGQLMFFLCHQEILSNLGKEAWSEANIESLTDNFSEFINYGINGVTFG